MKRNILIIGGGVAGLTSAIYLSRAGMNVKVLTGFTYGSLSDSPIVENFPGILKISGFDLLDNMKKQAENFGAEIIDDKATKIDFNSNDVYSDLEEVYHYDELIIATGSKPRQICAKNANNYNNKGIHYCATCDGMLYKDKHVCVVGGGNTALTEALYLSNICKTVTLIVRKDKYRADEVLVNKVNQQSNIIQLMESTIEEFCGENKLNHVVIKTNDKISSYDTSAVFVAIGSEKNDEILKHSFGDNYNINDLPLNIKLCGDLIETKHQAVIAAASGAKVAMDVIEK